MIKYMRVSGVTVDNATGLSTVTRTPEGIAMGAIPEWDMLIDPAFVDGSQSSVRDRAKPNSFGVSFGTSINPAIQTGQFENGEPAIQRANGNQDGTGFILPATVNPDAWTLFFVVRVTSDNTSAAMRIFANASSLSGDGKIGLYVAISGGSSLGNNLTLFEQFNGIGGPLSVTRLQASVNLTDDVAPSLLMVTFSTKLGTSIYKNGTRLAANANDKRPLTIGLNSGENNALINSTGRYGYMGLINSDLNATENTGHRRAIEKFLMAKYDIPEGAQ